jgi:hypothetical protein
MQWIMDLHNYNCKYNQVNLQLNIGNIFSHHLDFSGRCKKSTPKMANLAFVGRLIGIYIP